VGSTPEILKIPVGEHDVRLTYPKQADWERKVDVLKDSELNLKAQITTANE